MKNKKSNQSHAQNNNQLRFIIKNRIFSSLYLNLISEKKGRNQNSIPIHNQSIFNCRDRDKKAAYKCEAEFDQDIELATTFGCDKGEEQGTTMEQMTYMMVEVSICGVTELQINMQDQRHPRWWRRSLTA
jgi:hypothetical protein